MAPPPRQDSTLGLGHLLKLFPQILSLLQATNPPYPLYSHFMLLYLFMFFSSTSYLTLFFLFLTEHLWKSLQCLCSTFEQHESKSRKLWTFWGSFCCSASMSSLPDFWISPVGGDVTLQKLPRSSLWEIISLPCPHLIPASPQQSNVSLLLCVNSKEKNVDVSEIFPTAWFSFFVVGGLPACNEVDEYVFWKWSTFNPPSFRRVGRMWG